MQRELAYGHLRELYTNSQGAPPAVGLERARGVVITLILRSGRQDCDVVDDLADTSTLCDG